MKAPPPDWPLAEISRIIPVSPHRWHVQSTGDGPDVVLIHGAGASTHSWRLLIPKLVGKFRVTAFDLPGQGFTQMGARGRSGLPEMSADIAALLAHLDIRPRLLIGHSAGAALALDLVGRLPEPPAGVVAINGALENFKGAAGWLFPVLAKLLVLNPLTGLMLSRTGSRNSVKNLITSTGTELDDSGLALYQRLFSDRKHVEATLAMMAQWSLGDVVGALPRITTPTLFLHGANDLAVKPDVARRAAAAMHDARCDILDGIGHLAQEEAPELVAERITAFEARLPK